MELLIEDVQRDIMEYWKRIKAAQKKLDGLSPGSMDWRIQKKIKNQRKGLKQEIIHVHGLINIAQTAINTGFAKLTP